MTINLYCSKRKELVHTYDNCKIRLVYLHVRYLFLKLVSLDNNKKQALNICPDKTTKEFIMYLNPPFKASCIS